MEPWGWAMTVIGGLILVYGLPYIIWERDDMKKSEQRERALYFAESQLRQSTKPAYTADELLETADKIEKYIMAGVVKPEKCDTCGK